MYKYIKRAIDVIMSAIFIIVLLPLFIITPLLILATMGLPILFKQRRIGLGNQTFEIYKFRTMRNKTDKYITDVQRITFFGRILRVSRIDEIPQLFNILKGDMSFIGPRPLLPDYLTFYSKRELQRHEVRPGLSGLSQVSGSYLKWEKQFAYDILYVNSFSFSLDISILMRTFRKIMNPSKKLISGEGGRIRFDTYRTNQKRNSPSHEEN